METKYSKIKNMRLTQKPDESWWVEVFFENGTCWLPALYDMGAIMQLIGQCEDIKYPYGKGKDLPAEFIVEAINSDYRGLKDLAKKYSIPNEKEIHVSVK